MNGTGKYSVWHYVGCGCAVLAALGLLAIGSCFYFGWRTANDMQKTMSDPVAREAKLRELLGYDELPEGYHPGFALSVPFVMDMAAVGDRELGDGERMSIETEDVFEERGFMFFRMRQFVSPDELQGDTDFDFDADERISVGEIQAAGARVEYTAQRGTRYAGDQPIPSVAAELRFDCDDRYHRFGVWFEHIGEDDEAEEAEPEAPETAEDGTAVEPEVVEPAAPIEDEPEPDYTGTPADEEALRDFLNHFDVCRS